jgi:hypothetical protein
VPQSVQLYGFAESWHLEIHATTGSCTLPPVRPSSFRKFFKGCLENHAQTCLSFHASNLLLYGLVRIHTVRPVPTNNTATNQNRKCLLGICALALLGIMPFLLLTFLSQAYSENLMLLFSMCLAHYPMHSFINLKMTFSLQSVFSPSPTLNPKAKIRSCLFQDQGS